jgi:quinol monooxygenase YgiN
LVAVVWQFTIHENRGEEFERFFGADGDWTRVSRRSRSFLGSSFLKDLAAPTRYLLIEYWSEMVVYERHVADYQRDRALLERQREAFTERVESLGVFSALDVPDRAGPAWSRRDGR